MYKYPEKSIFIGIKEMLLTHILQSKCVKVPLEGQDKESVITELVDLLDTNGMLIDKGMVLDAVFTRERTRSTGIGSGIAIPHGKCKAVKELVMALGLAIQSVAAKRFRKAGTSFSLEGDSSSLVTSGPFRYSRNPIYLGMLLWLLGLAILLGSLSAFALPVLVFLLANFILIPMEERSMREKFGEEYLDYQSRVRRWF